VHTSFSVFVIHNIVIIPIHAIVQFVKPSQVDLALPSFVLYAGRGSVSQEVEEQPPQ